MNDRFKFRVFLKYNQIMCDIDSYCFLQGLNKCVFHFTNGGQKTLKNDDFILMQCTGLKDKNGTLIYEGDIVRFIYGNKKRLGYVEENKTVWSITNSNFCQGAWCGGALINLYETCEIIGSIYENKELLECQK